MADPAGREAQVDPLTLPGDVGLSELASRAQELALLAGVRVATAESCTGGLVGHAITAIPGASAWYVGGVISYADAVKVELLAVPRASIERHGAVSAHVARAMAEGVRSRVGADIGVAVTGVAGPDGGTDTKPVGLTYVAAAGPASTEVRRFNWDGDRRANKEQSAAAALELLIAMLSEPEPAP
jgi:PncC family amidohydrolase